MPVSIKGSGGGSVTLDAGAAASATTLTLPNVSGTVLQSGTAVTAAQGGTGLTSPGTSGNVLTSNGTTWVSSSVQSPAALSTASGSAPSYSARAWLNFNGTGTIAIRASGNVTSITDNGVGDYTINFTTAMPDANYCFNLSANDDGTGTGGPAQTNGFSYGAWKRGPNSCVYATGSMRFQIGYPASVDLYDQTNINVSIFR